MFFSEFLPRRALPCCDSLLLSLARQHSYESFSGPFVACELFGNGERGQLATRREVFAIAPQAFFFRSLAAVCTRLADAFPPSPGRSLAATTRRRDI